MGEGQASWEIGPCPLLFFWVRQELRGWGGELSDYFLFSKIKGKAFLAFACLRLCEGRQGCWAQSGREHSTFNSFPKLGLPDLGSKKENTQFNLCGNE